MRLSLLRRWVLYSTLFGVFGSRFFIIVGGLTLFYFYFIVLFNLALLAALGHLWAPPRLRWFLAYIFGSGLLGLVFGTDSTSGFAKSFLGIALCALYSAALMRFFRFNAIALFRRYANFAFYSACYGLLQTVFFPSEGRRLVSLFSEPSAFAIVCVPAAFYYADDWQRNRRHGLRLIVLLIANILTFSSLGYLGLMLGGILFGLRYRVGRLLVPAIVVVAAIITFQQSDMFQMRLADTYTGLAQGDVSNLNESSFGIVANTFITERQFLAHPLLGGGLGSHIVAHDRFIDDVPGAFLLPENLRSLGQWDASSLFLRITSELGLVGLVYAFWFLWRFFPRGAGTLPEERAVAMALLCYVFMKFVRSGEYFGGEQFFFLAIYAVIGVTVRLRAEAAARLRAGEAAPLRAGEAAGRSVLTSPAAGRPSPPATARALALAP